MSTERPTKSDSPVPGGPVDRLPCTALIGFLLSLLLALSPVMAQDLEISSSFDPAMAGSLCGIAVEPVTDNIWLYQCSEAVVQSYTKDGEFLGMIDSPGEPANDVDLDFNTATMNLDSTLLPPGTLLFVNGETGPAEVYAVDKTDGFVIDTLESEFGTSHVVGGAHHPVRDSIYMIQDREPEAPDGNLVSEINPTTGVVLKTFSIGDNFDVASGDIDVCPSTGNLFAVSSVENQIAEFSAGGTLVGLHSLPNGVTELSGIGIGPDTGSAFVSGMDGTVWELTGLPCAIESSPPTGACQDSLGEGQICLLEGRFEMKVTWKNPNANNALTAVNLLRFSDTATQGYFVNPTNVEILAKVIDGCNINDHFWVFVGGLTDQNVIVEITDRSIGTERRYENLAGMPFGTVADTSAFATCP